MEIPAAIMKMINVAIFRGRGNVIPIRRVIIFLSAKNAFLDKSIHYGIPHDVTGINNTDADADADATVALC